MMKGLANKIGAKFNSRLVCDYYPSCVFCSSTRKLKSNYLGPAIRVRRSSDNQEQDIMFAGDRLDTAALLSFVGAGSGYVSKWYDQSGYSNHAYQTEASRQPRIVNNGMLDAVNSKPAVRNTYPYFLKINHSESVNLENMSVLMLVLCNSSDVMEVLWSKYNIYGSTKGYGYNLRTSSPYYRASFYDTSSKGTDGGAASPRDGNRHLLSMVKTSNNLKIYNNTSLVDNVSVVSQSITNTESIYIGVNYNNGSPGNNLTAYIHEMMLFNSDISNNLPVIYANQKGWFGL